MKKLDISNRLAIDNATWQQHIKDVLTVYRNDQTENGKFTQHPYYEPFRTFYESGNLEPLLDFATKNDFKIEWNNILATNPSRELEQYESNIKRFWAWVLDDEKKRICNPHLYEEPLLDNYFWKAINSIYSGGLCDPSINAPLFNKIFGETYQTEISFPFELGTRKWLPRKQLDPEELFTDMMHYLRGYLFYPHTKFGESMILITLEYWFSIIPVIRDSFFSQSGYFGLEMDGEAYLNYEMDENEENVYRHQDLIRSFFGLINGYKVRREEDTDEFVDNDPEIVEYIRVRFSEMDLPNEYHNLMDLLHRHKENALDVSETS